MGVRKDGNRDTYLTLVKMFITISKRQSTNLERKRIRHAF